MTLCFPWLPQLLNAPVHGVSILSRILKTSKTALCLFAFTGGLRELAEHLFTWSGEVAIIAPDDLRQVMQERLEAAQTALGEV